MPTHVRKAAMPKGIANHSDRGSSAQAAPKPRVASKAIVKAMKRPLRGNSEGVIGSSGGWGRGSFGTYLAQLSIGLGQLPAPHQLDRLHERPRRIARFLMKGPV